MTKSSILLLAACFACGGAVQKSGDGADTDVSVAPIFHLPGQISVSPLGAGNGHIVSTPAGINCPGQCSTTFAGGTNVTLTATVDAVSRLTAWSGACTGPSCTIVVKGNTAASASPQFDLRHFTVTYPTLPAGNWWSQVSLSKNGQFAALEYGGDKYTASVQAGSQPGPVIGTDLALLSVNDSGVAVGFGTGGSPGFYWKDGTQTLFPAPPEFTPWAINNDGLAVGFGIGGAYAVSTKDGSTRFLGPNGIALAVNSAGVAAGENNLQHAARFNLDGTVDDLGNLGGGDARATAINDSGVIVGNATLAAPDVTHAFVYTDAGGFKDLGALPGFTQSGLSGINSGGTAVGFSLNISPDFSTFDWAPMLYENGKLYDLGTLIDSSSGTPIRWLGAIDDKGDIAGSDALGFAVILKPD